MQYLNPFDYVVICLYFLALLVMGFWLQKRASRSLEDYFLGGKRLPWYLLGISGMGNFIDMSGTMIITSFLFMLGPRGLYVEFRGGAVLVLTFMMIWMGKWHRRSNCMTGAEWMIYRFGQGGASALARLVSVLTAVVATVGLLAYLIKGAGLFLAMFMPFNPTTCAAIMVLVTICYTVVSGFYGVVYTDLFQCGIILLAVIVVSVIAIGQINSYDGSLAALATEVTGNADWTSSVPSRYTPLFKGYEEFQPLLFVAFFYLLRNIMTGISTIQDPRYFAARNERDCGLLSFFWIWLMSFRWPMMISFAVIGLFLVKERYPDKQVLTESARLVKQQLVTDAAGSGGTADDEELVKKIIPKSRWEETIANVVNSPGKYPALVPQLKQVLGEDWKDRLDLVGYEGTVNPERIVPAVLKFGIPAGWRGLFIVALLAAAMSTFSPQVNLATALLTRDVYQAYLRPRASNRELILSSYCFGVMLTVAGFAMAYTTTSINDIWDWIVMGLGAGLAIPAIIRLYWWRSNAEGFMIGMAIGLAAAVLQRIFFQDWGPVPKFSVLTAISFLGTITATLLTKPTDRTILEKFYKTTRPFGFWRPLRNVLTLPERQAMAREYFYDLLSVPFVMGWQITLFLLPMQLMIRAWRSALFTLVIFCVCLIGLYLFWYRHLPPATAAVETAEGEPGPAI